MSTEETRNFVPDARQQPAVIVIVIVRMLVVVLCGLSGEVHDPRLDMGVVANLLQQSVASRSRWRESITRYLPYAIVSHADWFNGSPVDVLGQAADEVADLMRSHADAPVWMRNDFRLW
jgi:hypothetical protein